jgi:hypothetical protein
MAKKRNTDFFSSLRSQGLRKGVAKTLADLEGSSKGARTRAEKLARDAIKDLRQAADAIEKRLNIGGAGTRSTAAKKAAKTRKRTAAKKRPAAKKTAAKRAPARKTAARKTAARKTTARKTTRKAAGTARKAVSRITKSS